MLSLKSSSKIILSVFFLCFCLQARADRAYTENECLNRNYKAKIFHKGGPFGLIKFELSIEKDKCVIKVKHKKFFSSEWLIDVCREPIHIKVDNNGGVDVYKREGVCAPKDKTKFCEIYNEIRTITQDDGLIFAEGEKENLSTAHGQVYCAYGLINKYLNDGIVLSRFNSQVVTPNFYYSVPAKVTVKEEVTIKSSPTATPQGVATSTPKLEETPVATTPLEKALLTTP